LCAQLCSAVFFSFLLGQITFMCLKVIKSDGKWGHNAFVIVMPGNIFEHVTDSSYIDLF